MGLSDAARRVLEAAISLQEKANGRPPTQREIAKALNRYPRAVVVQLDKLEELGYVAREEGETRNLRILRNPDGTLYAPHGHAGFTIDPDARIHVSPVELPDEPSKADRIARARAALEAVEAKATREREPVEVAVVGYVSAGCAADLPPPKGRSVVVAGSVAHARTLLAFVVCGDSMSGPGDNIADGDVVVASMGEPVDFSAAAIHVLYEPTEGWTLKRLLPEDEELWLLSSNRARGPRKAVEGTVIAGRVIRVERCLR